ncbi:MAG: helix-turn-helix domain-containing protein [Xanthobacteraceae bacterium]|nr:helix-turn-helix domain-containing protein [Xanthobacteraceae bacterium]
MNKFVPAETFPPGEFLRDELDARGWTQTEFAEMIGRPVRLVNEIIAGKRAVTPETARDFAAAFGTSAQLWMNLETTWQLSKVPPRDASIAREAALRERFPVREMMKRGWISASKTLDELEASLFNFFGIKSILDPIFLPHAARRNYARDVTTIQWAWILRINQLASALQLKPYSEAKLRLAIPELEKQMMEPENIRHVPKILSDCGVRFVVAEPIPGSEIQGVCFWINNNKAPVIGLTLKGDQIDKFWFNLWHELEHVLNGDGKNGPILENFDEMTETDESEKLANIAAADHCVPHAAMRDFILRHNPMFSEKSLLGFARIVKRHPGIVAGQIQRQTGRWELFKKYQPRVRHIIVETALTDGYGVTI